MITSSDNPLSDATRRHLKLYVEIVRTTGDIPTRYWISTEQEFRGDDAIFRAGGMYIFPFSYDQKPCTVARPLVLKGSTVELWKQRQVGYMLLGLRSILTSVIELLRRNRVVVPNTPSPSHVSTCCLFRFA